MSYPGGGTPSSAGKVGVGRGLLNRHERTFKRGNLMFIEGESSTEMFIIKTGLVRIIKQEGENTVELARLGAGSVLGELSLLDHQPRSATAQVVEDTIVTVIDEELFTLTLKKIPEWLGNLVLLVVKRLRDTMKRTGDDIIRKNIPGVIQVMLLMMKSRNLKIMGNDILSVSMVREEVFAVIGLGRLELESVFLHLILKELLLIKKDESTREYIVIKDIGILRLYMNYLRVHQHGGTLTGESLSEKSVGFIKDLIEVSKNKGTMVADKLIRIGEKQLEIELDRVGRGRFINRDLLDELVSVKLVVIKEERVTSKHGHHSENVLFFNPALLESVLLLKKWLPAFTEEVLL